MSLPAVLGIDLAEQKFDAALLVEGKTEYKVCRNSDEGFEDLRLWLDHRRRESIHACISATDADGEELAIYLRRFGYRVSMVHPAIIHEFAWSEMHRSRTDETDSFLVARFCQVMKPKECIPPLPEVRSLEDPVRRADRLVSGDGQAEKQICPLHGAFNSMIQRDIAFLDEGIEKLNSRSK